MTRTFFKSVTAAQITLLLTTLIAGTGQSGLGDTLQSFFFSPNKTEPLIWAVGPVVLLPTARNDALGGKKWGFGPTALALKQQNGWTYGVLANHIWSQHEPSL